jgi:hypothetical protein
VLEQAQGFIISLAWLPETAVKDGKGFHELFSPANHLVRRTKIRAILRSVVEFR